VFLRSQTVNGRTYLMLVESQRVEGRIKQKVVARLGRLDELLASGQLDRMLASLGRFSEKFAVLGAHAQGEGVVARARRIGPALIFERLCEEQLFDSRRDLFAELEVVFFDTTSIYFEGEGGAQLGQHGHSKDHRPDLKQMQLISLSRWTVHGRIRVKKR
jgi:hypothetical protein